MSAPVIRIIVEQHAEEAAFLWLLRDAAVHAPHYNLKDLAHLDARVEAPKAGERRSWLPLLGGLVRKLAQGTRPGCKTTPNGGQRGRYSR